MTVQLLMLFVPGVSGNADSQIGESLSKCFRATDRDFIKYFAYIVS